MGSIRFMVVLLLGGILAASGGCLREPAGGEPDAAADAGLDARVDAADAVVDAADAADASPTGDCPLVDLEHAPPVVWLDGQPAVAVDMETLDATVTLDATAQTAEVEATLTFRLGSAGGMPMLDLRQTIVAAELDGEFLPVAALAHRDLAPSPEARMRVLQRSLAPCSSHRLTLRYSLQTPDAEEARPIDWLPGPGAAARWDFWFTDLLAGRYLEMWFPANLIYDRFTFGLQLLLRGGVDHTLITNAEVFELAPHHWQLEFAPSHTALSPMLVLRPSAELLSETTEHTLGSGQSLTLELHRLHTVGETMASLRATILDALEDGIAAHGDYPHGERLVVFVWDEASRSMEYDGGTTSTPQSLAHELFHAWYGRGVKPALGPDGWMDEAWTVWNTHPSAAFEVVELPPTASPMLLCHPNPWWRTTPTDAYDGGRLLFAHLAFLMGANRLQTAMTDFFAAHTLDTVTTAELERHLYCLDEDPDVAQAFHRWVYGLSGAVDPAGYPVCTSN